MLLFLWLAGPLMVLLAVYFHSQAVIRRGAKCGVVWQGPRALRFAICAQPLALSYSLVCYLAHFSDISVPTWASDASLLASVVVAPAMIL